MSQIPAEEAAPPHDGARPQLLVIGNAGAGSAQEEAVAEVMVALRARADVELVVPADLDELRATLEVQGDRRLVVLGGDGSVHAVAAALAELDRLADAGPVAIVPMGTGNDLARTLGLPLDPTEAAVVAVDGVPRRLEMLRAEDGGVVVNAVHAGIGAEAAARAAEHKARLGAASYSLGAAEAGMAERGWRLRVTVDGDVLHDGAEPVLMVAVGLGRTIGGGAQVAPDASPFDGLADVVVSASTGPLARLGYALSLRRGAHVQRDDVLSARGREVTVEALDDDSEFRTNADGEVRGPFRRRTWTCVPDAWQVVVPR